MGLYPEVCAGIAVGQPATRAWHLGGWRLYGAVIALSIPCAWARFTLVEQPLIRLRHSLRGRTHPVPHAGDIPAGRTAPP